MAIQNSLYGRDLSEDEAALGYQVKSDNLTKLASLTMPGNGNHRLSLNAEGTDFVLVPPDTNNVPEGTSNLYFTATRVRESITGAISAITTANLTSSRAIVSDVTGKVVVSEVTTTELGYLLGTTSNIQTQLIAHDTAIGGLTTTKLNTSQLGVPNGVATLDSNTKVPTSQIPAITTTVGFGGEVITVPYTGNGITIPLPINQGGTGTVTSSGALSALGAQPVFPILTTICSNASAGFLIKDTAGMAQVRSIQVMSPLTITNPSGIDDNPTLSLSQGHGSGLDADLLDGAHGSAYFKVDGTVPYSSATASTIRGSINAASSGANTDIITLSNVTGIGNTSSNHISITSSGSVGIGDTNPSAWGKVAIRGGMAGTGNSSLALLAPNGSNNNRANLALYSTFSNGADLNVRRAADIVSGFTGSTYGSEYLSLHVGGSTDARLLATERVRIDATGTVLVGKTTNTTDGGDIQISKGLTFPSIQVPCANINTLDDYKEGTWIPFIDSLTPGTGRVTTVHQASFTKVGNLVTFTAFIELTAIGTGGSGPMIITGLPYPAQGGPPHWAVTIPYFFYFKTAVMSISGTVQPSSGHIWLRGWSSPVTGVQNIDFYTYMQTSAIFILSGFYYAA